MTEKDKKLLLKDLCARLPYGVRVKELEPIKELELYLTSIYHDTVQVETMTGGIMACSIEAIKPYLRSMSSMTAEEIEEYNDLVIALSDYRYPPEQSVDEISDWLNSHHFDHHGLIRMGLALKAPEGIYKTE